MPYMNVKNTSQKGCSNPPCFEGFMVDLIYVIARRLHMFVRFYLPDDKRWGARNEETGEWNGMIGEVVKREVKEKVSRWRN